MTEFGGGSIKSLRFTLSSPATATSGNVVLTYNSIPVTGHIIGIEIGSPAFDAATGSLYMISSGTTWGTTRDVAQINGITAVARTFYPIVQFARSHNQGTILSGLAYSATVSPYVDGEQIGLATSGTYNGTNVLAIVYYR